MSLRDYCFTIRTKIIIDEDQKDNIKRHLQKLFRNKKLFGGDAFGKDDKLPFEIYFGLIWKDRKSVCLIMTSRAKDNVERFENIISKIKNEDLKIDENISLNKPEVIEGCDFERVKKKKGDKIWDTLEHNGPYFKHLFDPYQPHGAKIIYDKKKYSLDPIEEEIATYYARRIITERKSTKKFLDQDQFNKNFFIDFKKYLSPEHRNIFKDFNKLDFSLIVDRLDELKEEKEDMKKAKSPEEKMEEKLQKLEQKQNYSFAYVNGQKKAIKNPNVELSGLYIGQGNILTNKGRVKGFVMPEDVIINVSEGKVPNPPKGHKWGGVESDQTASWIAKYKDTITGKDKYVLLSESGDLFKFEKARKLNKFIPEIEERINKLLTSDSKRERQIGTIMYLIKNYGLRAGSTETEDGGEDKTEKVVGASTLMIQNVIPDDEEAEDGMRKIDLKFYGKDSVYFDNTIEVNDIVYNNILEFLKNKKPTDKLFDLTDANEVNKYLKMIDRDFSAKVFRTRLASSIMYNGLKEITDYPKNATDEKKIADFNEINRRVALKLNHRKGITEAQEKSVEKDEEKLKELKQKIKEEDKKEKKQKLKEQLKEKKLKLEDKKRNLGIALDTSKKNYIDPRIIISWADTVEIPITKIYKTKGLQDHFKWAIENEEEYNQEWDYEETPLDCIVGDNLVPAVEREKEVKEPKERKEREVKLKVKKIKEKESVFIQEYTDKSFIVLGDTYSIKDDLRILGGKFYKDKKFGSGWVFPNIKKTEIAKYLEKELKKKEIQEEVEEIQEEVEEVKPKRSIKKIISKLDLPKDELRRKREEEHTIKLITNFCRSKKLSDFMLIPKEYKNLMIRISQGILLRNKGDIEMAKLIIRYSTKI